MRKILQSKINELQAEHNRICSALSELKQSYDKLTNRRIELEGAMKEILNVMNTSQEVVDTDDSKDKASQRTNIN